MDNAYVRLLHDFFFKGWFVEVSALTYIPYIIVLTSKKQSHYTSLSMQQLLITRTERPNFHYKKFLKTVEQIFSSKRHSFKNISSNKRIC